MEIHSSKKTNGKGPLVKYKKEVEKNTDCA
jgi:hypothetical protein